MAVTSETFPCGADFTNTFDWLFTFSGNPSHEGHAGVDALSQVLPRNRNCFCDKDPNCGTTQRELTCLRFPVRSIPTPGNIIIPQSTYGIQALLVPLISLYRDWHKPFGNYSLAAIWRHLHAGPNSQFRRSFQIPFHWTNMYLHPTCNWIRCW